MKYEIRLTNVPDGAYAEIYLGHDRMVATKAEARRKLTNSQLLEILASLETREEVGDLDLRCSMEREDFER
jgi:hypothetical protein